MESLVFKVNDVVSIALFCILAPSLTVLTGLALSWNVYFIGRIKVFRGKYLEAIRESEFDPFDNYINQALSFKTEQVKYILLLTINSTEILSGLCFTFSTLITYYLWHTGESVKYPDRFTNHNCTIELSKISDVEFNVITEIPIGRVFFTLGQIGFIWSLTWTIYLIRYLHNREYDQKRYSNKYLCIVTLLVTSVILITGSLLKLRIFEILFEPLVLIIYSCIWIKHIKLFYKLLQSRVVRLKVEQASESIIIQARAGVSQFVIIMLLNIISFFCFLLSELITVMYFIVAIGIFYGPCLISYVYGAVNYEPLLRTPGQFQTLILADTAISIILKMLVFLAFLTISAHYSFGSLLFFWKAWVGDLKTRFGYGARIRYTPSLTNRLNRLRCVILENKNHIMSIKPIHVNRR